MIRLTRTITALCAALLSSSVFAGSEVPLQVVRFEHTYTTQTGQSVFVLGGIPELGGSDVRRSVKLVPIQQSPEGTLWRVDVAIPQGTPYSYRFVLRTDAVSTWRDSTNGTFLTTATAGTTETPIPAVRDRIVYSVVGDGATETTFVNLPGSLRRAFVPVPGRPDLQVVAVFDRPNGPGLDFRIFASAFDTPRHVILHRAGALFDYLPASSAGGGTITEFALPTTLIPATRTVNGVTGRGVRVYLPRGYAQETSRHYPVLYMHDGQNVFAPGGPFGCWYAESVADDMIRRGRIRELLIVAIDNSSNRLAEYNPEWQGGQAANANYNRFLVDELKPYVDANFRTLPGAADTGVMGSSFGGVASISVMLAYPAFFGCVGLMSTSFSYTTLDDRLAAGETPTNTRVYLDAGDTSDGGDLTVGVRDALLRTGRVLEQSIFFQIGFNQQHNEVAWNARLPQALEALYPITEGASELALPAPLRGDSDGDGCITLEDLTLLLSAYGTCEAGAGYNPAADLDENQCITLADLTLLLSAFGDCR
ncbi:MAG: hypothetical protein HZB38_10315 [Planctomycetes bacterium]|nr:hypothetical protein [Planctomycetota bacterium]